MQRYDEKRCYPSNSMLTNGQFINLKCKIERYTVVRNNNFLQVVEESSQLGKVEFVAADKGYDAHNNHKFVMFDIKAKSLIKLKNVSTKIRNWRKNYRKIAAKQFDEKLYHQRSKIETIFSMVKRKYNPKIRGKTRETQIQEGYHKLLTHNLDRLCKIISTLFKGFHQSHRKNAIRSWFMSFLLVLIVGS